MAPALHRSTIFPKTRAIPVYLSHVPDVTSRGSLIGQLHLVEVDLIYSLWVYLIWLTTLSWHHDLLLTIFVLLVRCNDDFTRQWTCWLLRHIFLKISLTWIPWTHHDWVCLFDHFLVVIIQFWMVLGMIRLQSVIEVGPNPMTFYLLLHFLFYSNIN